MGRVKSCKNIKFKLWGGWGRKRKYKTIKVCRFAKKPRCKTYTGKKCYVKNKVCHRTTCKFRRSKVCFHGKKLCRVRVCRPVVKPIRQGKVARPRKPMCKKMCPRGQKLQAPCRCVPNKKVCRVKHHKCKGKKRCGFRVRRVCKRTGNKCKRRVCKKVLKKKCVRVKSCKNIKFKLWGGWGRKRKYKTIKVCRFAKKPRCKTYTGKKCYVKNKVCHRTTCKFRRSKVCFHGKKLCRVRVCRPVVKPIRQGKVAPPRQIKKL